MQRNGSPDDLRALVTLQHLPGHWSDEGPLQCFSTDNGEHINVWPATGALQVKGHPQSSRTLEERLSAAIAGRVS